MRSKIIKFNYKLLRNREFLMFIQLVADTLQKNDPEKLHIEELYATLIMLLSEGNIAIEVESGSNFTQKCKAADGRRLRMHSAFYGLVKIFTLDEEKADLYMSAQNIMRIIKQAGNPWKLTDQARSYMIRELGNELKPYAADIERIGAIERLEELLDANEEYIELDKLSREDKSSRPSGNVKAVRRKINPVYLAIINAINSDVDRFSSQDFEPVVTAMNAIIKDYELILALRKGHKNEEGELENEEDDDDEVDVQ